MNKLVKEQRNFFHSQQTKPFSFRKQQLIALNNMLHTYEADIYHALKQDLNKSQHEVLTTELGMIYAELDVALANLKQWMKPKRTRSPLTHKGTKSTIYYEPYGVTLIISPWNYPLQLSIVPMIGAISAGNTVVLKPSEYAPSVSALLFEMIRTTFPPSFITVIEGEREVSKQLLEERFNYIFFTGNRRVGKIVMAKASKHLTPITLELGGKSPAIVEQDANIALAAKRIAWGKFTNAGQTCVAPDYVYVHETIKQKFIRALQKQIRKLYGKSPLHNKQYGRIVHRNHFERLRSFLKNSPIIYGGKYDTERLKIEPTIIEDITWESDIMREEIFGPLLPIMSYSSLEHVIDTLQQKEKPLALYLFSHSSSTHSLITNSLSFGGGCINDTLYHLANPHLPFGGIGGSGFGNYHGEHSFTTFSHEKGMLEQSTTFDIPIRYPGGKIKHRLAKRLLT